MRINYKIIAIALSIVISSCNNKTEETPLLIITDFGRDVDDAQAFAFLAQTINNNDTIYRIIERKKGRIGKLKSKPIIAGAICTGYISNIRAKALKQFLNLYNITIPIAVPEEEEKEISEIYNYYQTHKLNDVPYEHTLLKNLESYNNDSIYSSFYSPTKLLDSLLERYPHELTILVIAQPTQFVNALENITKMGKNYSFKAIYIQGQCDTLDYKRTKKFSPDFSAYNLREDTIASHKLFELQKNYPFIFVSKYATYPYALTKEETEYLEKGNKGKYLKDGAILGLKSFIERDSILFYKIFKLNDTIRKINAIDSMRILNNPYDLLTSIAIFYPDIFTADTLINKELKHILIK